MFDDGYQAVRRFRGDAVVGQFETDHCPAGQNQMAVASGPAKRTEAARQAVPLKWLKLKYGRETVTVCGDGTPKSAEPGAGSVQCRGRRC